MMTGLIGAAVGLAVALAELLFLRVLASRVELAETRRALRVAGGIQVILFPAVGWFVAQYFFGE